MRDKIRKRKWACVLTMMALLFLLSGCDSREKDGLQELRLENETAEKDVAEKEIPDGTETVFVYVCGAVHSPGVYELKSGARIYEAIEMAGGTTADAAQELINQAEVIADGARIYVPDQEEAEEFRSGTEGLGTEVTDGSEKEKININTAGKEELMTLTGIGEAKAQSILDYREEHGKFGSIEDLMLIEGIKEGVFNKIKEDITI